ncbi:MAG: hypothetical protein GX020_06470 [Firmicutes bacterium]|nr:hypothetical protein [Bacillota bacterium]
MGLLLAGVTIANLTKPTLKKVVRPFAKNIIQSAYILSDGIKQLVVDFKNEWSNNYRPTIENVEDSEIGNAWHN